MLVYTGTLDVSVDDVQMASDEATTIVVQQGGYLFRQSMSSGETPTSTVTLKVPPAKFDSTMSRLAEIGVVSQRLVNTEDVTAQSIDLASRITSVTGSVDRLRALLATAGSLEDVRELESELLERETQLEVLKGQLRAVEAQVTMATLTVVFTQTDPVGPAMEVAVSAAATDSVDICPADEHAELVENESVVICYELRNSGNLKLVDIRLDDPGLGLSRSDIVAVAGDPDELGPGEVVVLAAKTEAKLATYPAPRVSATAVDTAGERIRAAVDVSIVSPDIMVIADDAPPGFVRAASATLNGLKQAGLWILAALGAFAPLAPLAAIGLYMLRRRRTADGRDKSAGTTETGDQE